MTGHGVLKGFLKWVCINEAVKHMNNNTTNKIVTLSHVVTAENLVKTAFYVTLKPERCNKSESPLQPQPGRRGAAR